MIQKDTLFNRYPKTTLTTIIALLLVITLIGLEWAASHLFGLGKVVLYEANPIYGYRVASHQHVARNTHQRVHINNIGLRANEDWSDATSIPQKPRILFISDSVTYGGSYIDNENLFSEKIGKALPDYQTGNAGVNGWGVDNVVSFIKDTHFLQADIYVLMFPEGDFYRGLARIGGQPFWTRKPHCALEELWQYGIYKAHLFKTPHLQAYENSPILKRQITELAVQHLKILLDYLDNHNKKVLIYISPSLPQVLGQSEPDPILKDVLAQHHIPAIYLLDRATSLPENEKIALYHDVIHLSNRGHEKWAQWMLADLNNNVH